MISRFPCRVFILSALNISSRNILATMIHGTFSNPENVAINNAEIHRVNLRNYCQRVFHDPGGARQDMRTNFSRLNGFSSHFNIFKARRFVQDSSNIDVLFHGTLFYSMITDASSTSVDSVLL